VTEPSIDVPKKKPRLRGRIHLVAGVLAIPAAVVLINAAQAGVFTLGAAIYSTSLVLLLLVSGTYHTPYWPERIRSGLQRADRSMIFILIAGSYTPFLLATGGSSMSIFFPLVWILAALGVCRTVFLPNGRRWITTLTYIAMGWMSLPLLPEWVAQLGWEVIGLVGIGGITYTIGATAYAKRWPNPWPATFGYHEIFHVAVILGSACHYRAVWQIMV